MPADLILIAKLPRFIIAAGVKSRSVYANLDARADEIGEQSVSICKWASGRGYNKWPPSNIIHLELTADLG